MIVTTPFNDKHEVTLIKKYETQTILNRYLKELNINTAANFEKQDSLTLYECPESKICFFRPSSVMGNSSFYEQLQKYEWYYMDWKWEQEYVFKSLKKEDKVLEIGSGKGNFVKKLTEKGISTLGIEMNTKEVEAGRKIGLNISNESLKDLIEKKEQFSVICAFQVFEHIPDLNTIIKESIQLLQPGGRLIFSVPNMDSFIKFNEGGILNFPPHHINWFYEITFKYISKKYKIKLNNLIYEPLQDYHYKWYIENIKNNYISSKIIDKLFYSKYGQKISLFLVKIFSKNIKGHTILSEYINKA